MRVRAVQMMPLHTYGNSLCNVLKIHPRKLPDLHQSLELVVDYQGNLADQMIRSFTITCIPRNIEPSSIIPAPSTPSCFAAYASSPKSMFPIDAIAKIPITRNGVHEYPLLICNLVLSIHSMDEIRNNA